MRYDEEEVERLLAGGYLSGAQYDRIEARVLRRVASQPARGGIRRVLPDLAAPLGGTALVVGALALHVGSSEPPAANAPSFTAKGAAAAPKQGAVELVCSGAPRACTVDDTLMFVVNTSVASGYLHASAERVEPPSPERIWLFPTEDGESPRVEPGQGTTVVPQGIRLASLPGPGLYRVDIWFSEGKPLAERDRLRAERRLPVLLRIEN